VRLSPKTYKLTWGARALEILFTAIP
jgi:hypothetical protein